METKAESDLKTPTDLVIDSPSLIPRSGRAWRNGCICGFQKAASVTGEGLSVIACLRRLLTQNATERKQSARGEVFRTAFTKVECDCEEKWSGAA
jgi:hypothetical protein